MYITSILNKNKMKNLKEIYEEMCNKQSDINEHLPVLKRYSEECEYITEMGVRTVVSTYAFLMGKPTKLISIDIVPIEQYGIDRNDLKNLAKENNIDFEFVVGDTTLIEIKETDLLFIDTLHRYNQLKTELAMHADKAKKYIILHDTTSYAYVGEDIQNDRGLWPAVEEFLNQNANWIIHEKFENNNGLTILKRI
jgi:hypothetical protein